MPAPQTGAQRQAAHKARMQAAGLVRISVWVDPKNAQALRDLADRIERLHAAGDRGRRLARGLVLE